MQTTLQDRPAYTPVKGDHNTDKNDLNTNVEALTELKVNPLMRIHFGPPIMCDLLLDGRQVELSDSTYIELISQLDQDISRERLSRIVEKIFDVSTPEAGIIIADLEKARILVGADQKRVEMAGVRHWIRRGWLDALVLHLKSRNIDCVDDGAEDSFAHNSDILRTVIKKEGLPELWREYPDCRVFELPPADSLPENQTFEEVLLRRRSFEPWVQKQLKLRQLSTILDFANKENLRLRKSVDEQVKDEPGVLLNSGFSALETYFFAFSIEGLPNGIYHYDPRSHSASLLKDGLYREEVSHMCIGQRKPGSGSCTFLISAVFERYMYRYRHPRAYRNLLINVSEFAHRYILLSTALGLSTFMTPALQDEQADALLGVNGYEEAPLYVVAIG